MISGKRAYPQLEYIFFRHMPESGREWTSLGIQEQLFENRAIGHSSPSEAFFNSTHLCSSISASRLFMTRHLRFLSFTRTRGCITQVDHILRIQFMDLVCTMPKWTQTKSLLLHISHSTDPSRLCVSQCLSSCYHYLSDLHSDSMLPGR